MGYDYYYAEYHLTPRGWLRGDCSLNEPLKSTTAPPDDRVETWLEKITEHDVYGGRSRDWTQLWSSAAWSEEERNKLRSECRNKVVPEQHDPRRAFWDFPR